MKKKAVAKGKKSSTNKKTVTHYLRVYFVSVVSALVVFSVGTLLSPHEPTCANCLSEITEKVENGATGTFLGRTVIPPQIDLANDEIPRVLGAQTPAGEKHIYVDLEEQKLYAYQGNELVMEVLVSTGKWNRTPAVNSHIWTKLRATRMSGGSGADYYDLPNVPYTMYFYSDYALHGAYWHNNFGHAMSHGCVNLRTVDARDIFNWAEVGTPVSTCKIYTQPDNCVQS